MMHSTKGTSHATDNPLANSVEVLRDPAIPGPLVTQSKSGGFNAEI